MNELFIIAQRIGVKIQFSYDTDYCMYNIKIIGEDFTVDRYLTKAQIESDTDIWAVLYKELREINKRGKI